MAHDCNEAIAIWDGISKGTQANINQCAKLHKNINIYRTDICQWIDINGHQCSPYEKNNQASCSNNIETPDL